MKRLMFFSFSFFIGAVLGMFVIGRFLAEELEEKTEMVRKWSSYYNVLVRWIINKQNKKGLETYFKNNNYESIAIYGMREVGDCLYNELSQTDIKVKYVIDKDAENIICPVKVFTLEDELEEVDAVIVTPIYCYNQIYEALRNKINCPIVSLADIM